MKGGYPLPQFPITTDTLCMQITIPADDNIRLAVYGQMIELTKWWNWQKDGGMGAKETADEMLKYFPFFIEECGQMDCSDVENCLEESAIIDALESADQNLLTSIGDLSEIVTNESSTNVYEEAPTLATAPDKVCDVAYYITDQLIQFIDDTLTDASTITLSEFLLALLRIGGFNTELLKLFWDFIIANANPNLLADITAQRDTIAQAFYCNDLDRDDAREEINLNQNINADVKAGIIGALDAIADSTLALWISVGQLIPAGEDCTVFDCEANQLAVYDFTIDEQGWISETQPTPPKDLSVYVTGQYWENNGASGTDLSRYTIGILSPAVSFPTGAIVEVTYTINQQGTPVTPQFTIWTNNDAQRYDRTSPVTIGTTTLSIPLTTPITSDFRITIRAGRFNSNAYVRISKIVIRL
jgi:hypothetical protein